MRTRVSEQIEDKFVFQIDWNLRKVLLNMVAVAKLSVNLKIWIMSLIGRVSTEFIDMADLSRIWLAGNLTPITSRWYSKGKRSYPSIQKMWRGDRQCYTGNYR